jgi:hypothetical protein
MYGKAGLPWFPFMFCHLVFQYFLDEPIRVYMVLDGYPAGFIKSSGFGFALKTEQAITATVELLRIPVLLKNQLHKPMKIF